MRSILILFAFLLASNGFAQKSKTKTPASSDPITLNVKSFGLYPDRDNIDAAPIMDKICDIVRDLCRQGKTNITIDMPRGLYFFHPQSAAQRTYYISNHDQKNPKNVGIPLEYLNKVTLNGHGSTLVFYGRMLPISLIGSTDCTLKDLRIDFCTPHIAQAEIVENDDKGIKFRMSTEDDWVLKDSVLYTKGEGWIANANYAIAFDGKTRHLLPQTSDLRVYTHHLTTTFDGKSEMGVNYSNINKLLWAKEWKDSRLKVGTRLAMRTWARPTPGIFLADDVRTTLKNVKVHYAEGMGLLAQMCEDITADGFSVCLRTKGDYRYFTTQADATHFSGCKGTIIERNGLFEGMMDDAINVHGTYLKIIERKDDHTFIGQYMHDQSYGFRWGEIGDTVQFITSQTMELIGQSATIASIHARDAGINNGVKQFLITFNESIDPRIDPTQLSLGMENLTWTPKVIFENNTIRNNRARGSLFSTPRQVIVRNNTFDHTSGCAILLCGDCNGWYETGACRDVLIEGNHFINALTNEFQFTNAIISIYPEIPDLEHQQQYFHRNIRIIGNQFNTFLPCLLYAKSVDGLTFLRNKVNYNHDFSPYHWNKQTFLLEHVKNFETDMKE